MPGQQDWWHAQPVGAHIQKPTCRGRTAARIVRVSRQYRQGNQAVHESEQRPGRRSALGVEEQPVRAARLAADSQPRWPMRHGRWRSPGRHGPARPWRSRRAGPQGASAESAQRHQRRASNVNRMEIQRHGADAETAIDLLGADDDCPHEGRRKPPAQAKDLRLRPECRIRPNCWRRPRNLRLRPERRIRPNCRRRSLACAESVASGAPETSSAYDFAVAQVLLYRPLDGGDRAS